METFFLSLFLITLALALAFALEGRANQKTDARKQSLASDSMRRTAINSTAYTSV